MDGWTGGMSMDIEKEKKKKKKKERWEKIKKKEREKKRLEQTSRTHDDCMIDCMNDEQDFFRR